MFSGTCLLFYLFALPFENVAVLYSTYLKIYSEKKRELMAYLLGGWHRHGSQEIVQFFRQCVCTTRQNPLAFYLSEKGQRKNCEELGSKHEYLHTDIHLHTCKVAGKRRKVSVPLGKGECD